jgi:glycosyltransferase involved in cell wall biosynthesis
MASPTVVLGVPVYNGGEHLREALESLLSQSFRDFRIVLVDDLSDDDSAAIAAMYMQSDLHVEYVRNEQRLGMVLNWRRAFELARERHPDAPYFAWASDHDVWHPRFLERLVAELEAHPEAVLAYPRSVGIADAGEVIREPFDFEVVDVENPRRRMALAHRRMAAGFMVYALFRAEALAASGVYRLVLLPDRLLLTELAWHGQFRQVPEILWHRRFRAGVLASLDRQRRTFFPEGAPIYSYLPWPLTHAVAIAWAYGVRGAHPSAPPRRQALGLALFYLRLSTLFEARRRLARRRHRYRGRWTLMKHRARKRANRSWPGRVALRAASTTRTAARSIVHRVASDG